MSSGVRNLMAMFEQSKAASSTAEPRDALPSNGSTDSPSRASAVRASFFPVERPVPNAVTDPGTIKSATANENSVQSGESSSIISDNIEEKEEHKHSHAVAEAVPEQAIASQESPNPSPPACDTVEGELKSATSTADETDVTKSSQVAEDKPLAKDAEEPYEVPPSHIEPTKPISPPAVPQSQSKHPATKSERGTPRKLGKSSVKSEESKPEKAENLVPMPAKKTEEQEPEKKEQNIPTKTEELKASENEESASIKSKESAHVKVEEAEPVATEGLALVKGKKTKSKKSKKQPEAVIENPNSAPEEPAGKTEALVPTTVADPSAEVAEKQESIQAANEESTSAALEVPKATGDEANAIAAPTQPPSVVSDEAALITTKTKAPTSAESSSLETPERGVESSAAENKATVSTASAESSTEAVGEATPTKEKQESVETTEPLSQIPVEKFVNSSNDTKQAAKKAAPQNPDPPVDVSASPNEVLPSSEDEPTALAQSAPLAGLEAASEAGDVLRIKEAAEAKDGSKAKVVPEVKEAKEAKEVSEETDISVAQDIAGTKNTAALSAEAPQSTGINPKSTSKSMSGAPRTTETRAKPNGASAAGKPEAKKPAAISTTKVPPKVSSAKSPVQKTMPKTPNDPKISTNTSTPKPSPGPRAQPKAAASKKPSAVHSVPAARTNQTVTRQEAASSSTTPGAAVNTTDERSNESPPTAQKLVTETGKSSEGDGTIAASSSGPAEATVGTVTGDATEISAPASGPRAGRTSQRPAATTTSSTATPSARVNAKSKTTVPEAQKPAAARPTTNASRTSVSPGGFKKPRPKSPTRPLSLSSRLTAPTTASAAKQGEEQKIARNPSTKTRPVSKPVVGVKSSRNSLAPSAVAHKRSESRSSMGGGSKEGFLQRMMRPTTSSASKTQEKLDNPHNKTSSKGSANNLVQKGKKKVEEAASKMKQATTNESEKDEPKVTNEAGTVSQASKATTEDDVTAEPLNADSLVQEPQVLTTAPQVEAEAKAVH